MPTKPAPKAPSPDDQRLGHVRAAVAKSAAKWLQSSLNIQRSIASLSAAEITAFCEHVCSTWTVEDSRYRANHQPPATGAVSLLG